MVDEENKATTQACIAEILEDGGEYQSALGEYEEAKAVFLGYAKQKRKAGEPEQAIKYYEKGLGIIDKIKRLMHEKPEA